MKYRLMTVIFLYIGLSTLFTLTVNANSSWHWVTTSPKNILPFAVLLTLLIEVLGIVKFNQISNIKIVFTVVCLANVLSFIAPYLERAYRFIPTSGGFSITAAFSKGPYYMVLLGYLILTLVIEIPVVYFFLRKLVQNRKKLIAALVALNVLTTAMVAVTERVICIGQW